jgi:hypothetical protein
MGDVGQIYILIGLAYVLFFGISATNLAKQKGRNEVAWFFAGAIFGPFGVMVIGFSTDLGFENKLTESIKLALAKDAPVKTNDTQNPST